MNDFLRRVEWRQHLVGIVVFTITLILLMFALYQNIEARDLLRNTDIQKNAQISINNEASNAKLVLDRDLPIYQSLKVRGVIGEAVRLAWIETLQTLANSYQLPKIQFALESEKVLEQGNSSYWHEEIVVEATPMHLDFELMHEGDFYLLLNGMKKNAKGVFSVEQCQLNHAEDTEDELAAQVKGACDLLWYSLSDVTEQWEAEEQ